MTIARFKPALEEAGPCVALLLAALPEIYAPLSRFAVSDDTFDGKRPLKEWGDFTVAWRGITQALVEAGNWLGVPAVVTCDASSNPPSLVEERRVGLIISAASRDIPGDFTVLHCRLRRVDARIIEVELLPHRTG